MGWISRTTLSGCAWQIVYYLYLNMEKWTKFVDKLIKIVDNFGRWAEIRKNGIGLLIIINLGQGLIHLGYRSYPQQLRVIN